MRISIVRAKCKLWGHRFEVPLLSDFSYGDFIYSSQDGKKHRFFESLNNKTWNFVEKIVSDDYRYSNHSGDIIQMIIGRVADKDQSVKFFQNRKTICPECGENVCHVFINDIVGFVEVEEMTFHSFEKLSTKEKAKEVKSILDSQP